MPIYNQVIELKRLEILLEEHRTPLFSYLRGVLLEYWRQRRFFGSIDKIEDVEVDETSEMLTLTFLYTYRGDRERGRRAFPVNVIENPDLLPGFISVQTQIERDEREREEVRSRVRSRIQSEVDRRLASLRDTIEEQVRQEFASGGLHGQ